MVVGHLYIFGETLILSWKFVISLIISLLTTCGALSAGGGGIRYMAPYPYVAQCYGEYR